MDTKYNLQRFVDAQNSVYHAVLAELNEGKKQTHWMWFVFPQLKGLGKSGMSEYYGISGIEEARAYMAHSILGTRYVECLQILLHSPINNPEDIFGHIDSKKLHSSLTLFTHADTQNAYIIQSLEKFYAGEKDYRTEKMLGLF